MTNDRDDKDKNEMTGVTATMMTVIRIMDEDKGIRISYKGYSTFSMNTAVTTLLCCFVLRVTMMKEIKKDDRS